MLAPPPNELQAKIGRHFFSRVKQENPSLIDGLHASRSSISHPEEAKVPLIPDDNVPEEDEFVRDGDFVEQLDENSPHGFFGQLKAKTNARFHAAQLHQTLATVLNICALCSTRPFQFFPKDLFWGYFAVSIWATYCFFYNFRKYESLDFEDLHKELKGP